MLVAKDLWAILTMRYPSKQRSQLHQRWPARINQPLMPNHTTSRLTQRFSRQRHSLSFRLRTLKSTWQSVWQVSIYEAIAKAILAEH